MQNVAEDRTTSRDLHEFTILQGLSSFSGSSIKKKIIFILFPPFFFLSLFSWFLFSARFYASSWLRKTATVIDPTQTKNRLQPQKADFSLILLPNSPKSSSLRPLQNTEVTFFFSIVPLTLLPVSQHSQPPTYKPPRLRPKPKPKSKEGNEKRFRIQRILILPKVPKHPKFSLSAKIYLYLCQSVLCPARSTAGASYPAKPASTTVSATLN